MNTPSTGNTAGTLQPLCVDAAMLAELLGLCRATIFALNSRGVLPRPVRLTKRAPRWRIDEIRAWLAAGCPTRDQWELQQKAAAR